MHAIVEMQLRCMTARASLLARRSSLRLNRKLGQSPCLFAEAFPLFGESTLSAPAVLIAHQGNLPFGASAHLLRQWIRCHLAVFGAMVSCTILCNLCQPTFKFGCILKLRQSSISIEERVLHYLFGVVGIFHNSNNNRINKGVMLPHQAVKAPSFPVWARWMSVLSLAMALGSSLTLY